MSGCDSAHGAYPQRLHGPAGQRRDAAAGARADEMGADEREFAAGAVRFPALEASQGKAAAGAQRNQPRQNDADRKSTRLNSSHRQNSYAGLCLKKKKRTTMS